MSGANYRIRIIKEGVEFEAEGDKTFVIKMLDRFEQRSGVPSMRDKKDTSKVDAKKTSTFTIASKTISIGEFIRNLGVKKHTDIVLAFGYYLEKHSGLVAFTPADINNCYYESKMEASNTSQMIIQNIRRGRMMASKGETAKKKKAYRLTRTGEDFIESKITK